MSGGMSTQKHGNASQFQENSLVGVKSLILKRSRLHLAIGFWTNTLSQIQSLRSWNSKFRIWCLTNILEVQHQCHFSGRVCFAVQLPAEKKHSFDVFSSVKEVKTTIDAITNVAPFRWHSTNTCSFFTNLYQFIPGPSKGWQMDGKGCHKATP